MEVNPLNSKKRQTKRIYQKAKSGFRFDNPQKQKLVNLSEDLKDEASPIWLNQSSPHPVLSIQFTSCPLTMAVHTPPLSSVTKTPSPTTPDL
ncbi:hypothetical protein L1987_36842 [Smallanthus sonchifolius]|uniref:Uncharacterized protein n=1 Tax=Smallanthus sonchifolius TaxID=185202 RepID=A0ACB9HE93_9ASTR|nr:hypothetical protein L1987_36842 [Smallanthus sonchifolius]